MEFIFDLDEIEQVARQVIKQLKPLTLFYGNLGSGKTTFIKALLKTQEGISPSSSPSFALVNEYETKTGNVYHLDLYRINNMQEALDIGVEEYIYSETTCYIEWPQIIESLLPKEFSIIRLEFINQQKRKLTLG